MQPKTRHMSINDSLHAVQRDGIALQDSDAIRRYLQQHPDMIGLLPRISAAAPGYIASRAALSLEVYHDPEIADEYLTFLVRLPKDADASHVSDNIQTLLHSFAEELTYTSGWLIITLDMKSAPLT